MSQNECRYVYNNVTDILEEQGQLVETVRKRLKDWKPDSTFHEIVYKITSNLKMYEEYVNNYTKVSYIFCFFSIDSAQIFDEFSK